MDRAASNRDDHSDDLLSVLETSPAGAEEVGLPPAPALIPSQRPYSDLHSQEGLVLRARGR